MASFKAVVFRHHKKSDGTYNVKIQVIHNRKYRYIGTSVFVTDKDMTRGMKIKNASVIDIVKKMTEKYYDAQNMIAGASMLDIDELIDRVSKAIEQGNGFSLDFNAYARGKASLEKKGTASVDISGINSLCRFAYFSRLNETPPDFISAERIREINGEKIDISRITVSLLGDFCDYIAIEPSYKANRNGDLKASGKAKGDNCRSQTKNTASVRKYYNLAQKEFNDEDRGFVPIPRHPFDKFTPPKQRHAQHRDIDIEIMQYFIDMKRRDRPEWQDKDSEVRVNFARDVFLLSFMLAGMNLADLYNAPAIVGGIKAYKGGVVTYRRQKTADRRQDLAEMKMRVEPEAVALFGRFSDRKGVRLFDFYRRYSSIDSFESAVRAGLRQIESGMAEAGLDVRHFTFYSARHTWATLAQNVCGVDKYTVHEALDHAPEQYMKETDTYTAKDYSRIWEANRKVLSLFDFRLI